MSSMLAPWKYEMQLSKKLAPAEACVNGFRDRVSGVRDQGRKGIGGQVPGIGIDVQGCTGFEKTFKLLCVVAYS